MPSLATIDSDQGGDLGVPGTLALAPFARRHAASLLNLIADAGRMRKARAENLLACSGSSLELAARSLESIGAIRSVHPGRGTRAVEYRSTASSAGLRDVLRAFDAWAEIAMPAGAIDLESDRRRDLVRNVIDAWASAALVGVANGLSSISELEARIVGVGAGKLHRAVKGLRDSGLIFTHESPGGKLLTLTDWGAKVMVPLLEGYQWELEHIPDQVAPIHQAMVSACLCAVLPRVALGPSFRGRFILAVKLPDESISGVCVKVRGGEIVECVPIEAARLDDSWSGSVSIGGSTLAWAALALKGDLQQLRFSTGSDRARRLARAIHQFFGRR